MVLELYEIRDIANRYDYEEIGWNVASCMISFRGGGSNKSTRINIYYTTGTVGTCLNHPKRGKTQLFRRGIRTLDALEDIFDNPRSHTGEGYYQRKNIRQNWKRSDTNEFICDTARRWMYVGYATNLFHNDRERKTVSEICELWDDVTWPDPDTRPNPSKAKYSCGTKAALMNMLVEIVEKTWGEYLLLTADEINSNKRDKSLEPPDMSCSCSNLDKFMSVHGSHLVQLQHKLMSLRKDLRAELVQWFLQSRGVHSYGFTDMNLKMFASNLHHEVDLAHIEYGDLNYPRNADLCHHCGV